MSAATIARALGGHRSAEGYLCRCPLPSHGKGSGDRNPSLFVKDGDKAPLFKCFAGCDARDIVGELRGRGLCPQDGVEAPPIEAKPFIPEHKPDPEALALWQSASAIEANTAQATYIRSRGLTGHPPPSLRATTILHLGRYPFPAIVAAVQAPARQIISIQCTLIDQRGERKAAVAVPRRTVGAIGCGAVRLAAATDGARPGGRMGKGVGGHAALRRAVLGFARCRPNEPRARARQHARASHLRRQRRAGQGRGRAHRT